MKKYFILTLLAFSFIAQAQVTANRFFYELTFKPHKDSLKTEKELMILDIDKVKSVYQSYEKVVQDSIFQIMMAEVMKTGSAPNISGLSGLKESQFPETILKKYPINEILFTTNLGIDLYKYNEAAKFNWKIGTETKKFGNYNAQKATVNYGGRNWIAWFSTELPFTDGPYKFYGLPGLIIKIEDSDENYSWVLNGNKMIQEVEDKKSMFDTLKQYGMTKELTITKEQFIKLNEEFKKDPTAGIRQMAASYGISTSSINTREINKRAKENLGKKNNSIELHSEVKNKITLPKE